MYYFLSEHYPELGKLDHVDKCIISVNKYEIERRGYIPYSELEEIAKRELKCDEIKLIQIDNFSPLGTAYHYIPLGV